MMTLQEVADEMGISKQMVYKIEQRALAKCRKALEEKGLTLRDIMNDENTSFKQKLGEQLGG